MHTSTDRSLPPPGRRVLHLTISFARGGRRDAILTLARAGRQEHITPFLATLRGSAEESIPYSDDFEQIHDLHTSGLPRPHELVKLRDWCRKNRIEVVHAHDAASQFVASALRLVAPTQRIVMTFHRSLGIDSVGWRNRLRNAISLLAVSRVVTASAERRRHFIATKVVPKSKVVTIPLGIDLGLFKPDSAARTAIRSEFGLAPDELLVVSAGHYGPEKGLDIALDASALAAEVLGPSVRFSHLHLGTGTAEQVAAIHERGDLASPRRVILAGYRSDPERCFAAADLFLHTPRMEAFGLVLVQAMASGLANVATAVGGIPEIVLPEETGILVSADDTEAIAIALARLLGDDSDRGRMATAALGRARTEYGDRLYAHRHRVVYDSVLAGLRSDPAGREKS